MAGKILTNMSNKESVYNVDAVDAKLDTKPNEAPKDGKAYWRQNGKWTEIHGPIEAGTSYIGEIFYYPKTTPPPNALVCDGSAISREEYSKLFEVIGTTFGVGDGSTTFNLPDMMGEFVRGYDPENKRDPQGSTREFGKHQDATESPLVYKNAGAATFMMVAQSNVANNVLNTDYRSSEMGAGRIVVGSSVSTSGVNPASLRITSRPTNINLLPCIRFSEYANVVEVSKRWQNVPLTRRANNSGGTFTLKYNASLGMYEVALVAVVIAAGTVSADILATIANPNDWPAFEPYSFRSQQGIPSGTSGMLGVYTNDATNIRAATNNITTPVTAYLRQLAAVSS